MAQSARGEYSRRHIPFVALAGTLVYIIDRAMVRQHWTRHGKIQAAARGFAVPFANDGFFKLAAHWVMRVVASLVLGLTTAGFMDLALFEHDVTADIADQTRAANEPVLAAAEAAHDATIASIQHEIDALDAQIAAVLGSGHQARAAVDATAQQISGLADDRASLQERIRELDEKIDCLATDKIAEDTGGLRCDNTAATAGRGNRFEAATQLLEYNMQERRKAQTRITEIDAELERLQAPAAPMDPAVAARLDALSKLRAEKASAVTAATAGRGTAVRALAEGDLGFVEQPEGLILRGEALERLSARSPWLATRVWLVFASLTILDLAAVLVLSLLPPPLGLSVGEVLASEEAAHRLIAHYEHTTGTAMIETLGAREATVRAQTEANGRIDNWRTEMATRRQMSQQIDAEIKRALDARSRMN